MHIQVRVYLRRHCTLNLKLACFVCFLKIVYFFEEKMQASQSKLSTELKNGIRILVGQAVFKLWIKTVKIMLTH